MKPGSTNSLGEEQAHRVAWLVAGYLRQALTEKEHDELDQWIVASPENQVLFEELTSPAFIEAGLDELGQADSAKTLARVKRELHLIKPKAKTDRNRILLYAVAASVALIIALFILYPIMKPNQEKVAEVKDSSLEPGGNHAILMIGEGRSINLEEAKNGLVDSVGKTEVLKVSDGQLSYEHSIAKNTFHTLVTPSGGQYGLLLQDGSRVWLNASSSLRFPAAFDENERIVELQGEGYFEVARKPSGNGVYKPFHVKCGNTTIEVLGTKFNVNAYNDEPVIATTLLEGSVRVNLDKLSAELKPGEQARTGSTKIETKRDIDLDEVIAWKNGQFKFIDATIETIMRQVSRWYDAEIVFDGKVNYHFNATIYRHEPVSKLLKLLEETNRVHFSIQGNRITVRP